MIGALLLPIHHHVHWVYLIGRLRLVEILVLKHVELLGTRSDQIVDLAIDWSEWVDLAVFVFVFDRRLRLLVFYSVLG